MSEVLNIDRQLAKIATIRSLDELAGYRAEARRRGIDPAEALALAERERALRGKA